MNEETIYEMATRLVSFHLGRHNCLVKWEYNPNIEVEGYFSVKSDTESEIRVIRGNLSEKPFGPPIELSVLAHEVGHWTRWKSRPTLWVRLKDLVNNRDPSLLTIEEWHFILDEERFAWDAGDTLLWKMNFLPQEFWVMFEVTRDHSLGTYREVALHFLFNDPDRSVYLPALR